MADQGGHRLWGLLAEFEDQAGLREAVRRVRGEGYRRLEAYTPYPVEGLAEELGHKRNPLRIIVLLGGLVGGVSGYLLQVYCMAVSYPLNIAGRPPHSWPSFIPVTFEMTVLFAAFSAVLGMLALNGLPQPYHPVFNVPRFGEASRDRFFLEVEARDPRFDRSATERALREAGAADVFEVPK